MNIYAFINGLNALLAFIIIRTLVSVKEKSAAMTTHLLWLTCFFLWTFFYLIWGFQTDLASAMNWLTIIMYPCCFIHTLYFHFILAITHNTQRYKYLLVSAYISSVLLTFLNFYGGFFDKTKFREIGSFPYWPLANKNIWLLFGAELFFILLSFIFIYQAIKKTPKLKKQLITYLSLSIFGWIGGLMNWAPFFEQTPIPPFGNLAVTVYVIGISYFLIRNDVLHARVSVNRAFAYAISMIFISFGYIALVSLLQKGFQKILGYESFIVTFLSSLIIAVLFIPINLMELLEKYFFGRNVAVLSKEHSQMSVELQKQDRLRAVATFAAGMAHEIKNPLTSIRTFAEYLPAKYDDASFRKKFQSIVVNEVDRVNSIVKQVLEFSKPQEPEMKEICIKIILEETLSLVESNPINSQITILKNILYDTTVLGDKNQLKQAFLNILLNSVQSMPNGGDLTISTSKTIDAVEVQIVDTGNGISDKDLAKVFDPFFTTRENGTGLGLSIVYGIIQKHGGRIQIRSKLGEGTTVSVILKNRS